MAYKINGTTVVDNSRNVCACCVTSCCITASSRMDAPSGTTAQRPGSPATGSIYFDTDLGSLISYDGTAWNTVGGSSGLEIDDIATNDNDPWAFMTMVPFDNFNCRCYMQCCHGGIEIDIQYVRPATYCLQAECFQYSYDQNRFSGCNVPMYVDGPYKFCGISDFCKPCYLSSVRAIPVPYRMSYSCEACVSGGCATLNNDYSGYDGSINILHRHNGVNCLCGFCVTSGSLQHWYEHHINRKGGVTGSYINQLNGVFCNLCNCARHPYRTFPNTRYHGFTKYGAVAGIRAPLCVFENASCGFKCNATFIVTSDTFGTGNEEICCFAWKHNSTWNCANRWYRIGGYTGIANYQICLCPAQLLYGSGCFLCCLCHGLCGQLCCSGCCMLNWSSYGIMEFFNKRTDVYGGSNITDKEAYTNTKCTYSDGLTIKNMPIGNGCEYGLSYLYGFEACCYCLIPPSHVYDSDTYCRFRFLSRDGCYIHFIKKENLSNSGTAACCCGIDCQHTACRTCFGTLKRIYYSRINRITGCFDCHYGECCLCFPTAFCCIGCTKGTHRLPNCLAGHDNSIMFQNKGFRTPRQPSQTILHTGGTGFEQPFSCRSFQRTLEDFSWNAWSHVCTRKAIFINFACDVPSFTVWDCCKELLECTTTLGCLNSGCEWNKFTTVFGVGPCYICQCGSGVPQFCYMVGGIGGSQNHCKLACCIQNITGCAFVGLSQKCLGYVLKRGSHGYSFFGFLPTGNGSENNTYWNRSNDHIVMIRAMKHDSSSCTCGCQIYWIGAICYDIHNDCISKVNTFYPSPACELQRICCCWNTIYQNSCCEAPLQQRCQCINGWKGCLYWYSSCNSNGSCGSNHISAIPYGNKQYYEDSGCTDLGGVILNMSNSPGERIIAMSQCNSCSFYWYCTALGCNIGNDSNNTYMCIMPGQTRMAKVPYTTPLECVGWRSEPDLACWMNFYFFPEKSPVLSFLPITAGDTCHDCLVCCMSLSRHKVFGCVKQTPANNCFVCHIYGTCDCNRGNKEFKIWDTNCCLYFCCCAITGATNGTYCARKMCDFFKCASVQYPGCAEIYDNILPCHLDSNETSKRYAKKFFQSPENLVSKPYYAGGGSSFFGQWLKHGAEDANSRFTRLWHEDVIECC